MSPEDLRRAREALGLTPAEAAEVLETDVSTIYKIERSATRSQYRKPPARVAQLYTAYLSGFRPGNWPKRLLGLEQRKAEIGEVRT